MDPIRLDRRALVRSSVAGFTALLIAGHPTASAGSQATPTARGKTIPELRIAVPQLPYTLDPQEWSGIIRARVYSSLYDTLIRRDYRQAGALVPGLAADWTRVDDKTLDLTLRRDVLFQDDTPFTAADVAYTFDRILSRDPELSAATPTEFPLARVEALDDVRVRLVSLDVDALLEERLAGDQASIVPAAYHQRVGREAFRAAPIGTGPYRLVEFVQDGYFAFQAHEAYFGGAPAAERMTMRAIPEVATRVAALLNGEVDLVVEIPPDQVAAFEGEDAVAVKSVPLANLHGLWFNMRARPTDRREVRQALSLAIDREALVDALWGGNASVPHGWQLPGEFYNPERPATPYDPERARALLAEGGYAGEEVSYYVITPNYYTLEREAGEAIIAMWRDVGVNVRLAADEVAVHTGEFENPDSPYHASTLSQGGVGPDDYLMGAWGPDGVLQKAWWLPESAARYNELGHRTRRTFDQAERFALYQRMLDEFDREAPGTPLYQPNGIYAMADGIDWTPSSGYDIDLRPRNFRVR